MRALVLVGVSLLGLGAYLWARHRQRPDTKIDGLIAEKGQTPRFAGTDEDARLRALGARVKADMSMRVSHRIRTGDIRRPVEADRVHPFGRKVS